MIELIGWSLAEHELQSFTARYYAFEAILIGDLILLLFLWFWWDYLIVGVYLIFAECELDLYGMFIKFDLSLLCMLNVLDANLLFATLYLQFLLFFEQHSML